MIETWTSLFIFLTSIAMLFLTLSFLGLIFMGVLEAWSDYQEARQARKTRAEINKRSQEMLEGWRRKYVKD